MSGLKLRILILTLTAITAFKLSAQSVSEHSFFDQLRPDAIILSAEGIIQGKKWLEDYTKDLLGVQKDTYSYSREFSINVHDGLDYEVGSLTLGKKSLAVMFLKTKDHTSSPTIEFLVIYEQKDSDFKHNDFDGARKQWMQLCNSHNADELVKKLYAEEAYYYNRGRLLQGTEAIAAEYGYMNDPNYSLKLTPKHITIVSPNVAYEIGRCSGSYPNPYMLVWKRVEDDRWVILMDSNY